MKTDGIASELIFYIKPRRGVTARLAAMAAKQPGISKKILIEGPYGGVSPHHMSQFDTLLVIAGGSGGGFSLAMVDEALRLTEKPKGGQGRRNLQVVFSTRDVAMADWYKNEIECRLSKSTMLSLEGNDDSGFETSVSLHVTSNPARDPINDSAVSFTIPDAENPPEKKMPAPDILTTGSFSLNVHRSIRPDIPGFIARSVAMANSQGTHVGKKQRIGVLVCGPASMLHDTRNAAALAQTRTLGGEIEELYLHSEPFA